MLIHQFPDIEWLKTKIREGFSDRKAINDTPLSHSGWPTVVLNTTTRQADRRDIKGPFSLFLNLSGKSIVGVEGKQYQINEQCFTLSNSGQHYDLIIDDAETTETLNIHFGEYFYTQSIKAISESERQLLDNPFDSQVSTPLVNPRTLLRNEVMNKQLGRLLQGYRSGNNPDLQEEILFELLKGLMTANCRELKKTAALPIKSVAVREEIAERLFLARDYIHSHFDREVALDELSRISCLSKFHFLRLFKQAFRQSPYQYQKALRVDRAMSLYKQGKTLEEIAEKVGIENASSISRMIYKQFGVYPSQLVQ